MLRQSFTHIMHGLYCRVRSLCGLVSRWNRVGMRIYLVTYIYIKHALLPVLDPPATSSLSHVKTSPVRWKTAYKTSTVSWKAAYKTSPVSWKTAYKTSPVRSKTAYKTSPVRWKTAYKTSPVSWKTAYKTSTVRWKTAYKMSQSGGRPLTK